jgi:streptomycin 6-kinase
LSPNHQLLNLSSDFIRRIVKVHGPAGESWIKNLPALRARCFKRWSLSTTGPLSDLSNNYLEKAKTKDGSEVILKLGPPNPELTTEILALKQYRGKGAVRLLQADPQLGALLLEQVHPCVNLLSIKDDEQAARIASQVMERLWRKIPDKGNFPTMANWCRGFSRYRKQFPSSTGPLPPGLIEKAEKVSADLFQTQSTSLLLHGDLHQRNILMGKGDTWVAVDPKGVIGESSFEVGPFLYNPIPDLIKNPDLTRLFNRRLDIFEEILKLDRVRMAAWSFSRAVLSAVWTIEDKGDNSSYWITCAERLLDLLPE